MSTNFQANEHKDRLIAALHSIGQGPVASAVKKREVTTTRLSDLLKGLDPKTAAHAPFILAATEDIGAYSDITLYTAVRDLVDVWSPQPQTGDSWRMDLVHYTGITLPWNEANRSIGHWNPSNQVELFQVLDGHPTILAKPPTVPNVQITELAAGDLLKLRGGDWHITFCPKGEAIILNVYSCREGAQTADKYFSKPPVPLGIQLTENGFSIANPHAIPIQFGKANRSFGPTLLWNLFTARDISTFSEVIGELNTEQ